MSESVAVGIDVGDREWRVACAANGRVEVVPLPESLRDAAVFFDPRSNISSLGVRFPELLQGLGRNLTFRFQERDETPEGLLALGFREMRRVVQTATGSEPSACVVAVPAGLGQVRRGGLLECARAAGWEAVSLIDQCTAAALVDHGGRDEPKTTLVLSVGYGGCEFSLVRLAKGHCAVLTTGSAAGVSGEVLDAVMMEGLVLALRKQHTFLGLGRWGDREWMEFRRAGEALRSMFADDAEPKATLPALLARRDPPFAVRLSREQFARRIEPLLLKAVAGVREALDQNQLELTDVDSFLLIGSSGTSPVVEMCSAAFDGKPRRTEPGIVAAGAAWQAWQVANPETELDPGRWVVEQGPAATYTWTQSADAEVEFVEVAESAKAPGHVPPQTVVPEASPAAVRSLLSEGLYLEAEVMADALFREAESLKAEVANHLSSPARRLLARAQATLRQGQINVAVSLSHQAHDEDRADPIVFEGMMKVHADAGSMLTRPEDYAEAIKLLECAHRHDQSDRSIHKALTERHYKHALAMQQLNNVNKALVAVKQALNYDYKHPGANQLLRQLSG